MPAVGGTRSGSASSKSKAPPRRAEPARASKLGAAHRLGLSPLTAAFSGRATVDPDEATALAASGLPDGVRTFRVDGSDFATAGADNGLELALTVAAAVALDVTSPAFGIQEGHVYNEQTHEVFPGMIDIVDGWLKTARANR
mgnify:CR=1 FL=1